MRRYSRTIIVTIGLITLFAVPAWTGHYSGKAAAASLNPVDIKEWPVPWDRTRPRDPYVDQQHRVWFVGQGGDYIAVLDSEVGQFHQFKLDPGTGPHNLIVDEKGQVWYAGNRAAHIGTLDPATGHITKYPMPDPKATDPHTLVFGKDREIWFTVQQGNFVGHLDMDTGQIQLIPLLTPHARPYGIIMDATHSPWFAEFGTTNWGRLIRTHIPFENFRSHGARHDHDDWEAPRTASSGMWIMLKVTLDPTTPKQATFRNGPCPEEPMPDRTG